MIIAIGPDRLPSDERSRTDLAPSRRGEASASIVKFCIKQSRQSEPQLRAILLRHQIRSVGMTSNITIDRPVEHCTRLLGVGDTHAIVQHYVGLPAHDRYLRFCGAISDFAIERFVRQCIGRRDHLFMGYVAAPSLIGIAHLAPSDAIVGECELALSVDPDFRRRGIAKRLAREAIEFATERNALCLRLSMSLENKPMISLAREVGFEMRAFNNLVKGQLTVSTQDGNYGLSKPAAPYGIMCTEVSRQSY